MTAWNRLPAVTLKTLFFMIGAEPIDLNRTTTVGYEGVVGAKRQSEKERGVVGE